MEVPKLDLAWYIGEADATPLAALGDTRRRSVPWIINYYSANCILLNWRSFGERDGNVSVRHGHAQAAITFTQRKKNTLVLYCEQREPAVRSTWRRLGPGASARASLFSATSHLGGPSQTHGATAPPARKFSRAAARTYVPCPHLLSRPNHRSSTAKLKPAAETPCRPELPVRLDISPRETDVRTAHGRWCGGARGTERTEQGG